MSHLTYLKSAQSKVKQEGVLSHQYQKNDSTFCCCQLKNLGLQDLEDKIVN